MRKLFASTVITSLIIIFFYFFGSIFSHPFLTNYSQCQTAPVTTDNVPLMTHLGMRKVLYNEADQRPNQSADLLSVSDLRYVSLIRSRLTEPDLSKPRRLARAANPGEFFSESGQAKLIEQKLKGRRNGFFIECGAHDGEYNSNTLFFELERNWTGLLIEPNPKAYKTLLEKNRRAHVFYGCVSTTNQPQEVEFVAAGIYGGIQKEMPRKFVDVIKVHNIPNKLIPTICFPLGDILASLGVTHVDYLSLDIEGPELHVLKTINWKIIKIDILTIEIHGDLKKAADIMEFMKSIGEYRFIGRQGLDVVYEKIV